MLDDGFHPKFVSGFWSKAQTADEGVLFSMNHPLVGFKAMPKTIETYRNAFPGGYTSNVQGFYPVPFSLWWARHTFLR